MSSLKFCFLVIVQSVVNARLELLDNDVCLTPNSEEGRCVGIYSCKPIMDILDKLAQPVPAKVKNLLKSYHCGFSERQPNVCCPSKPIFVEGITTESRDDVPPPPDVSNHSNIGLLPNNCGVVDTGDRIVNGNKVGLFEFPWMALLSYRTNRGLDFQCGASILNDRYILTAASCITGLKNLLLGVRVGDFNIKTEKDCLVGTDEQICAPPYKDLAIEETIPHPEYNNKLRINDIGLLRVTPMDFTQDNIKPVCLPLEKSRTYNFTNRNSVITGWGVTESGQASPELLKAQIPAVSQDKCVDMYKNVTVINHRQLCAGGGVGNSCAGDNGGPLQVLAFLHEDIRTVQQGIFSFGPRCYRHDLPGVYTRVAYYMDWILDTMKP